MSDTVQLLHAAAGLQQPAQPAVRMSAPRGSGGLVLYLTLQPGLLSFVCYDVLSLQRCPAVYDP